MDSLKKSLVIGFLIVIGLTAKCFGYTPIKLFKQENYYYVVPVESILSIKVHKEMEKMKLYFDAPGNMYMDGAKIKKISDEDAWSLIEKIYNKDRKEILIIKVDSF